MLSVMFPMLQAQPGPSTSQVEVVLEHRLAFGNCQSVSNAAYQMPYLSQHSNWQLANHQAHPITSP